MDDEKDIVERLNTEAKNIEMKCSCSKGLHNTETCLPSRQKRIMFEAAHEIEELRSLNDAMKEGR